MRLYLRLLFCLPLLAATACASDSIAGPKLAPALEPEAAVAPETAVQVVSRSLDDSAREPIYIINGVILFSTQALESLTVEDIRSIEVIKIADEGSYYENLAKRSVVIITTHAAASRRR